MGNGMIGDSHGLDHSSIPLKITQQFQQLRWVPNTPALTIGPQDNADTAGPEMVNI